MTRKAWRLTESQWEALVTLVYQHAEKQRFGWWGDWDVPGCENTDDRVTFGSWRAGIEDYIFGVQSETEVTP